MGFISSTQAAHSAHSSSSDALSVRIAKVLVG